MCSATLWVGWAVLLVSPGLLKLLYSAGGSAGMAGPLSLCALSSRCFPSIQDFLMLRFWTTHTASLLSYSIRQGKSQGHSKRVKKQILFFNRKSYKATFTAMEFMPMKHSTWLWTRPWGYSLPFCGLYLAVHKQVNKLKRSENAVKHIK